jgi:hypothetical protein
LWKFILEVGVFRQQLFVLCLLVAGHERASANIDSPVSEPVLVADSLQVQNSIGLQLRVVPENTQPSLRLLLPGWSPSDRSIEIQFPEHVTAAAHGGGAEQLYLFRPGGQGERPAWRRVGQAIEYERDLRGGIHFLARAVLDDDGVRFHYEFLNNSSTAYDMIYAVTDPRLTSIFHDVRLERTYVHHSNGWDLLASETPARLTMSLNQWLPARYLAAFTWPIPAQLVDRRSDGITYYNKSHAVDQPVIATVSTDGRWIIASFARDPGNVWSNPELTCQHVDPQRSVGPGQRATLEVKMLVLRGSLDDVLRREIEERAALK